MTQTDLITDLTPLADCSPCIYRGSLLASGACKPGDCCVAAESGRQIDRFFRAHPSYAADYTQDGFWERRAIAARYLPVSQLQPLLADPDEAVRRMLAYRIPLEWLMELLRAPPALLEKMLDDVDEEVRLTARQRWEEMNSEPSTLRLP